MSERSANGIPLDDRSWDSIVKAAEVAGVSSETVESLTT
jgi:LDH2 family malate/lactate/ureidoglycolate dehydrogenase